MGIFRRNRRRHSTTRETVQEVGVEIAGEVVANGFVRLVRGIVSGIAHALS